VNTHRYRAAGSDAADRHVFMVFPRKRKICYPDTEAEIEHSVTHVYSTESFNIDTLNQAYVEECCFISRQPERGAVPAASCLQPCLVGTLR
jgi:hypothetical protein